MLAADCEKAWPHAGLEDTMQKWCDWLGEMKKNEIKKLEEVHQRKVSQMIKIVDGSAGLLHGITKQMARRGGVKSLKEVEEEPGRWIAAKKRGKR